MERMEVTPCDRNNSELSIRKADPGQGSAVN